MRIVLAEFRGEQKLVSREFKQAIIKLGRDQLRCNLVFDQKQWPMVSRLHAELRFQEKQLLLVDLNSTHGTFLNGERVSGAKRIQVGSRVQLGPNGPVFVIELIEAEAAAQNVYQTLVDISGGSTLVDVSGAQALPPQVTSQPEARPAISHTLVDAPAVLETPASQAPSVIPEPQAREEFPAPPVAPIGSFIVFETGGAAQVGRQFALKTDKILLGRDVAADITIDAAAAAVVSRRHAEIQRQSDGSFVIVDLNSFNGTLVNEQRIRQPTALRNGDRIQLGIGGPILRFISEALDTTSAKASEVAPAPAIVHAPAPDFSQPPAAIPEVDDDALRTIVYRAAEAQRVQPAPSSTGSFLLFQCKFNGKQKLSVGRAPDNDIHLDGLLISKYHARFVNTPQGVMVEDAGSTNGVYLNGERVAGRHLVESEDVVQIGPFVLKANGLVAIAVFDTRAKTRIDAIAITETVPKPAGRGVRKLLDEVSLAIEPNEFVGVLGPSGAGKSTLLNVLNGMRRTLQGRVLINSLELYQHVDSLKQSIGYVPQDDIMHRELTVYRTLYYVARLRLSRDVGPDEIDEIIGEVLEVSGLSDRRDVLISQLSGGQRKRVSIAVELITKPSVIFLDEPTSGLDPATEQRMMNLFRQIAESGRTIILTTHAMENVRLFDKIVVLMAGKLIFYGTPSEALEFLGARDFIDLYNRIEEPVEEQTAKLTPLPANATRAQKRAHEEHREAIAQAVADDWRSRFLATELYRRYIWQPLSLVEQETKKAPAARRRRSIIDSFLQWVTLIRRYTEVLARDKLNLFILFAQAPVIGLLTYLVVGEHDPRDFAYFMLALVSIWFGTSVAARELVKERPVYTRERMVNLGLLPYVGSKLFVLSFVVGLQAALLFGTLKIIHHAGMMYLPGRLFGLPHLLVMVLTSIVGIALGLFVSAMVKTSEVATSLVPLILIPQILFAGLIGVPTGISRVVGAVMPATWSFDEIKRLSTLDTLREEGSDPNGPNKGSGLYQHTKDVNAANIRNAREQMENYTKRANESIQEQNRKLREGLTARASGAASPPGPTTAQTISPPPPIPEPLEIKDDLSDYVSFKHPWGSLELDPAILVAMLMSLVLATIIALRAKDVR
jgi:ABC transport system ATP-binding/permease protein